MAHGVLTADAVDMMPNVIEELTRAGDQLMARVSGPFSFRLVLQPLMAAIFAVRGGIRDARAQQVPFLMRMVTRREDRIHLLRSAWHDVATVFVVAVGIDVVYQIVALQYFYPLQTVIVASTLAFVPYLLVRGSVSRAIMAWQRLQHRH